MQVINSRSTKAQLIEALEEANVELDILREACYTAQPITANQLLLALSSFRREASSLVVDIYNAGVFCRKACQPLIQRCQTLDIRLQGVTVNT